MARKVFLAPDGQEDAGAVEESMGFVDMRTAHREIPGIHHVLDGEGSGARFAAPGMVVGLGDPHRITAAAGLERFDLAGEISNKIAAGNPRRKGQCLALRIRLFDGQGDAKPVAGEVMRFDYVKYLFGFHSSILTSKKETA